MKRDARRVMRVGRPGWPSNMDFLATADPKTSARFRFRERALDIQRERVSELVHPWRMLGAPPPPVPVSFLDTMRLFRPSVMFGQDEREIG
jgi:hypothetical protein